MIEMLLQEDRLVFTKKLPTMNNSVELGHVNLDTEIVSFNSALTLEDFSSIVRLSNEYAADIFQEMGTSLADCY